jgi:phage baseplate assembly protein W
MAISTRIGTASNLPVGGTYDLLLLTFPAGFPEGQINFDLDDTPRKVSGIQKVSQMFLKILMTTRGTDVLNPTLGTAFSEYTISANRTGVDTELYAIIRSEVASAEKQVKYMFNSSTNTDLASQLYSVKVLGLNQDLDSLVLFVKITTLAGESASVACPFPQLDLKITGE